MRVCVLWVCGDIMLIEADIADIAAEVTTGGASIGLWAAWG